MQREMMIDHLPNPTVAQPYRIPHLARGYKSVEGKSMVDVDRSPHTIFVVST